MGFRVHTAFLPVLSAALATVLLILAGCASAPPPTKGMLDLPSGIEYLEWRSIAEGVEYSSHPGTRFVPQLHMLRIDLFNPAVEAAPAPLQTHGSEPHQIARLVQNAGQKQPAGQKQSEGASVVVVVAATPFRYVFSWRHGFLMKPVGVYKVGDRLYSRQHKEWGVLWQAPASQAPRQSKDPQGRLRISDGLEEPEKAGWAAGGYEPILLDGKNVGIHAARNARTAVGLSRNARFLYILVVEGDEFSRRGLTSRETAAVIALLGAYRGMNFDGGDSAFLLIAEERAGKTEEAGRLRYMYRGARRSMACFFTVRSRIPSTSIR